MILVSTIWFSGMPDIMVWPEKHNFDVYHNRVFGYARHIVWLENTLDIALWLKSKMETRNYYNCQQKGSRFVILVTTIGEGKLSDFLTKPKTNSLPKTYFTIA